MVEIMNIYLPKVKYQIKFKNKHYCVVNLIQVPPLFKIECVYVWFSDQRTVYL